jgi:prepilin-type processing-associated H-X9-DG protein
MSLPRDWEETGGKPQASPDRPSGASVLADDSVQFGKGVQFYRRPDFDPVARRRLLELMGAVLIVFAVVYVMIPVFTGTAETSRRSVCISHLHRLVQASRMYETDNEGMPPTPAWNHSLYHYILDRRGLDALFCPSEEANLPRLKRKRVAQTSSYTYVNPHERRFNGDETVTALFWDTMGGIGRAAHPGGGNVAFMDGHASWLPAQRWTAGDLP